MAPPTPIAPQERSRAYSQGMEQDTHLARLCCRAATPLARLSQRTGTTTADAGSVHDTQSSIGFSALFMRDQLLISRAAHSPIWLENKVFTRVAPGFPCAPDDGWSVPLWRSLPCLRRVVRGRELGGAQQFRLELMPQLQPQIPDPLCSALPGFLSTRGVTTPAIGIDLLVFVGEYRFKGTAMQVQFDDITGSERLWREIGEEELVHDACARDANRTLLFGSLMGGHHYSADHALRSDWHLWAVVETANHLTCLPVAGTDQGASADAPGQEGGRARCTLCLWSQRRTRPDQQALLPCHIVRRAAAGRVPVEVGAL
jgi:hypothetical protein